MTIRDAQRLAWRIAEDKGFHEGRTASGRDDTLVRLCLVHTEVSEAAQEVKRHWDGKPTEEQIETFGLELADALIRILDIAESVGADLETLVEVKMGRNRSRPYGYGTPQEQPAQRPTFLDSLTNEGKF